MRCGILLLSVNAIGCGPEESPYPTANVSGKITLDGQPLASGSITFLPEGGEQARPTATDFSDGIYSLTDAPLGRVRVRIISTKETGKLIPGSSEMVPEVVDVVPQRYRQGIELEIAGDNDQLDFDLTSSE